MAIKRFGLKHIKIMQEWLDQRGIHLPDHEQLPDFGLVAYDGETPVAMGFLRLAEGNYAILDGLITNPTSSPLTRDASLDELVVAITRESDRRGIAKLVAWTRDENTKVRSDKHGFIQQDLALIIRRR